jgi:hypothetical protein
MKTVNAYALRTPRAAFLLRMMYCASLSSMLRAPHGDVVWAAKKDSCRSPSIPSRVGSGVGVRALPTLVRRALWVNALSLWGACRDRNVRRIQTFAYRTRDEALQYAIRFGSNSMRKTAVQTLELRTVSPSASPGTHAEPRLASLLSVSTHTHAVAASSLALGMLLKTHITAQSNHIHRPVERSC